MKAVKDQEKEVKINEEEMKKKEKEIPITSADEKEEKVKEEAETKENASEGTNDISKLEKEVERFKELAARKTAELDNMMKRTLKEKNDLIEFGNAGLFNRLLPLMDDFSKAIATAKDSKDYDSLLKGFEMIFQKAQKTFEEAGVKKMEINPGDEFDVEYHEALMQIPDENIEEGKIAQVAQDGYMLKDRVLRHAKVVTSSGKPNNE